MIIARPRTTGGWIVAVIVILLVAFVLLSLGSWLWYKLKRVEVFDPPPAPFAILRVPIPDGPNADLIRRGRYLVTAGDCASCHTRPGGRPFAGGLGLQTPFGIVYSANLTSDTVDGIGGWTPDQFYRALHTGAAPTKHLYPAFPYPHFTIVSRADADAMFAFLKTVPPERYRQPANRLPFPLNVRPGLMAWDALEFKPHEFRGDPSQSQEWNRGAYLVEGLEHCGACHTPLTALGAENNRRAFQGGRIENWVAPDLTGNPRTGLGRWSAGDIVEFLRTGRNVHSNAAGLMGEVVSYSTSLLSDSDLRAITTYIKSLKASPTVTPSAPAPAAMRSGEAIYNEYCTACHLTAGKGQPRMFPRLAGSAVAQQQDPTGVIHLILAGGRTGPTPTRPSYQSMPSFAWKLNDQQVADVATYVRNAWGNRAEPVSTRQVSHLRDKLRLAKPLRGR